MWYKVLDNLSNSDPTKWDEIYEWTAIRFLNMMQYYRIKEKQIAKARQNTK